MDKFENERFELFVHSLFVSLNPYYIKVGDRDSLEKIISEMVEHRLDNPTLVTFRHLVIKAKRRRQGYAFLVLYVSE